MNPSPVLRLDDVTLAQGGRAVLSGVTLTVAGDEFIGMLGPNGAGKTTLMRAILGLLRPARGAISVFGRPATRGHAGIGYMPQMRSTPAGLRLRGRDVVAGAAGGARWGLPWPSAADRGEVDWALGQVEATALARRPLMELSGGERQRLLLAQALLGRPRLLLLDEPLSSLDPHHQQGVVDLVRHLQASLRLAVLFSAHELNSVLGAMDRVLYLGGGQAAIGTVDEVITAPVLSRLYGSAIDVLHLHGRIFVMSGGHAMERDHHHHGHGRPHA